MNFKRFLSENTNIFGFPERPEVKKQEKEILPIQSVNLELVMNLVAENTELADPQMPFFSTIEWQSNSTRVKLTPNIGVLIERRIRDLTGKPTWITKKLFKIKNHVYAGKEEIVANDISEEVINVAKTPLDIASRDYTGIRKLTQEMANNVKNANELFHIKDVKRVNENNYVITFSISNFGVGDLLGRFKSGPIIQSFINLNYNEEKGLIQIIFENVEKNSFDIDVPYFSSQFATSQSNKEIVQTLVTAMRSI